MTSELQFDNFVCISADNQAVILCTVVQMHHFNVSPLYSSLNNPNYIFNVTELKPPEKEEEQTVLWMKS